MVWECPKAVIIDAKKSNFIFINFYLLKEFKYTKNGQLQIKKPNHFRLPPKS